SFSKILILDATQIDLSQVGVHTDKDVRRCTCRIPELASGQDESQRMTGYDLIDCSRPGFLKAKLRKQPFSRRPIERLESKRTKQDIAGRIASPSGSRWLSRGEKQSDPIGQSWNEDLTEPGIEKGERFIIV